MWNYLYIFIFKSEKKYNLGEIFKKRYVTKHHSSLYIHFLGIWTHHLMALNIWCERTSCLVIPAPDKPLNSRLVYLTADWTSPLRCVIGISYITFLRITHVCPCLSTPLNLSSWVIHYLSTILLPLAQDNDFGVNELLSSPNTH